MNFIKIILSPFASIYGAITSARNLLFNCGILKSYHSKITVISVGNLSLGGTGKTPHVAHILDLVKMKNRAVISRGYKRKTKGMIEGDTKIHSAKDLGDEPLELLTKFEGPNFKMIVEAERRKALQYLENHSDKSDIIILDDAFQHRYAHRDLNILLSDYSNPFYADFIVPMGRLRESRKGAQRADIIIVTKCPKEISKKEQEEIRKKIENYSKASVYFSQISYKGLIDKDNSIVPLDSNKKYLLITGIANPTPIYEYLAENKIHFAAKKYSDHHNFSRKDIQDIVKKSENCDGIITTEKDWMRLQETEVSKLISIEMYRLIIGINFVNSEQDKNFQKQIINLAP